MPQYRGRPTHRQKPTGATPRELETARLAITADEKAKLRRSVKRLNPEYSEGEIDAFLTDRCF